MSLNEKSSFSRIRQAQNSPSRLYVIKVIVAAFVFLPIGVHY